MTHKQKQKYKRIINYITCFLVLVTSLSLVAIETAQTTAGVIISAISMTVSLVLMVIGVFFYRYVDEHK